MKPPEVVTLDFFGRRKYVVARVLQGGMGSVYQLVPIDTADRTVALKTIKGASSIPLEAVGRTRLSGEQILDLIRGTIDALDYAYSEFRLIHQDIRPANILIDQSGDPRLSDFAVPRLRRLEENI